MTLFFDRPYKDGGTYGTGKAGTYGNGSGPFNENSKLSDAGSDLWKEPEVVAVNHFRNAMVGEDSNVSNCGDDLCLMVERYAGSSAQDGVVVANANGSEKNLAGTSTKLANGTYTDEVTGSKLVVSGGTITSGSVKARALQRSPTRPVPQSSPQPRHTRTRARFLARRRQSPCAPSRQPTPRTRPPTGSPAPMRTATP